MNITADQADAMGGCQPCHPAKTEAVAGKSQPLPAVMTVDPTKPDWIGIELKTPQGEPVPRERFEVTLPDGHVIGGQLDNLGRIRIEGVDPGNCDVTFPERDAREWKKA